MAHSYPTAGEVYGTGRHKTFITLVKISYTSIAFPPIELRVQLSNVRSVEAFGFIGA